MGRRDSPGAFLPLIDTLHVFDDFCRDFDAVPVAWHLEAGTSPAARALLATTCRWIEDAQHVRLSPRPTDVPPLWFPVVALRILPDATMTTLPVAASVYTGELAAADTTNVARACTEMAARARTMQIHALRCELVSPPEPRTEVTVVVCTHRRPAALAAALESLACQTFGPDRFEVVVVDNAPDDPAAAVTVARIRDEHFARTPARLRLVACPFPGLSFARNAGIALARGAIVSFLDDDAEARPDWLARVVAAFAAHPHAGVVGGRVTLALPAPRPRWAKPGWGRYWSECATQASAPIVASHWWDYPFGANWSARRTVLVSMGGFRTRFGRAAGDAAGGEEIVAAALAERLGHAVVIDPTAEVVHRPDPARFTLGHVWRRIHAGKREEYCQERLGYLPPTLTLRTTAGSVLRRVHDAITARGLSPHERLEQLIYASAEVRLLPALARDGRTTCGK